MFICYDCQKEYETKPKFCDCGNNIFKEIKKNNKISFSLIFFLICIIFSLLILIFFNYPKPKETKKIEKRNETNQNIPEINSFWKEKKTKIINIQKTKEEKKEQKSFLQTQIPTQQKKENTKKTIPIKENTEIKPIIKEQDIKLYKNELRNLIFSNIAFDDIYENGSCSISFNIEQNGLLINKKTISSSQNIELNNAVFKALLKIKYFKTPPKSLNNHTYIFKINIFNDKYEASLN